MIIQTDRQIVKYRRENVKYLQSIDNIKLKSLVINVTMKV